MNIGIDVSQIAYPGTGVARYTTALLHALLLDKKHTYHCFFSSLRGKIPGEIQDLIRKTNTKLTSLLIPPTLLSWLWNDKHFLSIDHFLPDTDFIITSDWTEPPSKKKKIAIIHDMVVYRHPETTTQKMSWLAQEFAPSPNIEETQKKRLDWVKKESALIIADSLSTKRDIVEFLQVPEGRIKVIYPPVLIKKPTPDDMQRVKVKYHLDRPFLFTIGKQEPRKNILKLANAFHSLKDKSFELLIAGPKGWGDSNAMKNQQIRQLGFVDEQDLSALYQLAHGFVFPSLYEGFGYPVAEALMLGVPTACSNNSSVGEIAGDAALLFDPTSEKDIATALDHLIYNEKERDRCKKNCAKQASLFTLEKFRDSLLDLFNEL